jgi:Glycolipid 2-alpha-mannosyltransferase
MAARRTIYVIVSVRLVAWSSLLIRDWPVLVWSNFEIADMDFWRGKIYTEFFEYLDATGGFYYEVRIID